jgi:c(7)-type cytochrome triheme protein
MTLRAKQEKSGCRRRRRAQELVVIAFVCLTLVGFLFSCGGQTEEKKETETPLPPLPENIVATDLMENVDFSKFKHDSPRHGTVPCLLCHQQNEESVPPKFSSHASCIGCHAPQFKDNSHPICVICHTEPNSEKLKPFPPMTSFKANFNHTAHFKETNCATCHQTESGGGITVPTRGAAHATCFQCHTSDKIVGEKNIGSCVTCHEPGAANRVVDSTKNVGFNFDHARHAGVSCASCHDPQGAGNQMSAIAVSMHAGAPNSCATCHNEKRAFGANDFSDCRKCHQEVANARSFGVRFNHDVHRKTNCATCHKTGVGGVNFTVPNGEAAHANCFQCHSPNTKSGSFTTSRCFTCHQVGGGNNISPSPRLIAGNFSHRKHEFLDCNSCHTTAGGEMSAPMVVMHKPAKATTVSCASCHNNETAFGEDFSNCRKCHTGDNFKSLPRRTE